MYFGQGQLGRVCTAWGQLSISCFYLYSTKMCPESYKILSSSTRNFCYILSYKGSKSCSFFLESRPASFHKWWMNAVMTKYIKDRTLFPRESDKFMDVKMKSPPAVFWMLSVAYTANDLPAYKSDNLLKGGTAGWPVCAVPHAVS